MNAMGQEELVLRVSSEDNTTSNAQLSHSRQSSSGGGKFEYSRFPVKRGHSRESSGASVKFVAATNGGGNTSSNSFQRHCRTHSKASSNTSDGRVIILNSPSGEDMTVSDWLSSSDIDDVDCYDEEDLDSKVSLKDSSTGCEDKPELQGHLGQSKEGLDDQTRMHCPLDTKSQNSDYGSFCNTPFEDFGQKSNTLTGQTAMAMTATVEPGQGEGSGAAGGPGHAPDNPEQSQRGGATADDSSMMANDSYQRQPLLPAPQDSCSSDDEVGANSSGGYTRRKSRHPRYNMGHPDNSVHIDMNDEVDGTEEPVIPNEPLKTLVAFVFLFFAWVATTTSLALTHERVPEIDPLPDIILDNVNYQSWGLDASEIIIMVATVAALALIIFHQHRFVILRRVFFLGGIHYFYRAVCMFITVLPKADSSYKCASKLDELTFVDIAKRVVKLLSGMGLSINGQHVYCGDYIYSGHTMTLLMTYLVIQEYSPRRWFLLHWLSVCLTIAGVLTLLFSRGHYSIDVLIAYWITTRLWWIYHTLANNPNLIIKENQHNYLDRFWWWGIFGYFEGSVGRPLPKGFNWPVPEAVAKKIPFIHNWNANNQARRCQEEEEEQSGNEVRRHEHHEQETGDSGPEQGSGSSRRGSASVPRQADSPA